MVRRIEHNNVFVVQKLFVERVGIDNEGTRFTCKMDFESSLRQGLVGMRDLGIEHSVYTAVGIEGCAVTGQRDERLTGKPRIHGFFLGKNADTSARVTFKEFG